jgi:hypothetical protein
MVTAGGILVRGLDQSHTVTEETLEAGVKGGIAAARAVLTVYGRTLRQRFAVETRLFARGADGDDAAQHAVLQ